MRKKLYSEPINKVLGTNELENIFLQNDKIPKLSEEDKQLCDAPITIKECGAAPHGFQHIAWTRFYRSRSLHQGQRSNQGHTMMLHTYTP